MSRIVLCLLVLMKVVVAMDFSEDKSNFIFQNKSLSSEDWLSNNHDIASSSIFIIDKCKFSDEDILFLSGCCFKKIVINNSSITSKGVDNLMSVIRPENLDTLCLTNNNLGDEVEFTLIVKKYLTGFSAFGLKELDLSQSKCGFLKKISDDIRAEKITL